MSTSSPERRQYPQTLTTSTGSFFMLFGHVSSGLFSGSPGRRRIFSRFLTSSMRSLAALESSSRSLRTMSFGTRPLAENCDDSRFVGVWGTGLATSMEERVAGVRLLLNPLPSLALSNSAAAKISAEATTRRSEEV